MAKGAAQLFLVRESGSDVKVRDVSAYGIAINPRAGGRVCLQVTGRQKALVLGREIVQNGSATIPRGTVFTIGNVKLRID